MFSGFRSLWARDNHRINWHWSFRLLSHLLCVLWGIIILTEQRFKCAASRSAAPPWGFRRVRKQQRHLVLGAELHTFFCVRAEEYTGERGSVPGLETVTSAVPLAPLISTGSPSCPGISWNEPHTIKLKRFRGTFEGIFWVINAHKWFSHACFLPRNVSVFSRGA